MNADDVLTRLDKLKARSRGSWMACCPAHDDREPSLSVRKCDDGTILLKCFGGCSVSDIVAAVGLNLSDLFPDRPGDYTQPHTARRKPPISTRDLICAMRHQLIIVAIGAEQLRRGEAPSDDDLATLDAACPWSKLRIYIARFALVHHCLLVAVDKADPFELQQESMRAARELGEYFRPMAKKVYAFFSESPQEALLRRAIQWMARHPEGIRPRDMLRAGITRNANEAEKLCVLLCKRRLAEWKHQEKSLAGQPKPTRLFLLKDPTPDTHA
ncbi:MAG: hypothetical protein ACREV4_08545 [Gammaproteobacteria bacterium]